MKNKLLLTALATTSVLMGACTVQPVVHDHRYPYEETVIVAPPPPRYEYPGHPPHIDYVWIDGYWNWSTTRYVWVPGRWEAPRPGYYWVPHRWERDGNHWRRHGGAWERDRRPPPATKPPPPTQSGVSRVLEQQLGARGQPTAPPAKPMPPPPQQPIKPLPPVQAVPAVVPKPERDDHRRHDAGDRPRMERPGPPADMRSAPERHEGARARPDAAPRAEPHAAPKDGRDGRGPAEGTERPRAERKKAPEEKRAAPEPRDQPPPRPEAAPRMEVRLPPTPPPAR